MWMCDHRAGFCYRTQNGDPYPLLWLSTALGCTVFDDGFRAELARRALGLLFHEHGATAGKFCDLVADAGWRVETLDPVTTLMCSVNLALSRDEMVPFMVNVISNIPEATDQIEVLRANSIEMWQKLEPRLFLNMGAAAEARPDLPVLHLHLWFLVFGDYPDTTGCDMVKEALEFLRDWRKGIVTEQQVREALMSFFDEDSQEDDPQLSTEELVEGLYWNLGTDETESELHNILKKFGYLFP